MSKRSSLEFNNVYSGDYIGSQDLKVAPLYGYLTVFGE